MADTTAWLVEADQLRKEKERLREALREIAECPNEGPFLRRLARKALGQDNPRSEGGGS